MASQEARVNVRPVHFPGAVESILDAHRRPLRQPDPDEAAREDAAITEYLKKIDKKPKGPR